MTVDDLNQRRLEFEVSDERERCDEFLARCVPDLSLTRLRRAIKEGAVRVNGELSTPGTKLSPHDRVSLVINAGERTSATPEPIPLEVLHEDEEIIVVNKSAGRLMHPSRTEKSGTLTNALAYHLQQTDQTSVRPGLIHRLDRETSGVVVVAKTLRAHRIIAKAFRQRRVEKLYFALVCGRLENDAGRIEAPIGRDGEAWPRWRVSANGRSAVTLYTVKRRFDDYTFVEAAPLTGRTHQLRIHFAHIGHALAGDQVYGGGRELERSMRLTLPHQLLHAASLSLRHPADGREVVFTAPLPALMRETLERLVEQTVCEERTAC